jgi:hypothetical protein
MFSVCANPESQVSFNYQEGRLFRFHKDHLADEKPPNTHSVQSFWLCGTSCHAYTPDYRDGCGVLIKHGLETTDRSDALRFGAVA